jgi:vacuolar-type H+-ATPase subunit I/STV1
MYGLLTALAAIIVGVILQITGLSFKSNWIASIIYIPLLVGLILNAMAYAKANDNYVTFGNVYGSCFKATLILALVMTVWSFISMYIFPDMKDKVLEKMAEEFERKGTPEEQVTMILETTSKYWGVTMVFGTMLGMIFYGAILSLIAAAIPKKKGALPEHMQQQ